MTHVMLKNAVSSDYYPGVFVPAPLMMDELLEELQKPHEGASLPLVNVVEEEDMVIVEVAAPGLKPGEFLASIHENVLIVSVLHKEKCTRKKLYHRHEFNYECFKREIPLPVNIDVDFLTAVYKDGILHVMLPKSKEQVMNRIDRIIIY